MERRGPGIAYRCARALRIRAICFMGNVRSTSIPFVQYDEYAGSAKLARNVPLSMTPAPVATGSCWVGE
jgi:hypothetical protein